MKKTYLIEVEGWDDSSEFGMELTQSEYKVIKRVADKCTETSKYRAQPTMTITEVK